MARPCSDERMSRSSSGGSPKGLTMNCLPTRARSMRRGCARFTRCYSEPMFRLVSLLCFIGAAAAFCAEPSVDWKSVSAEALKHYQAVVRINSTNPPGNETKVAEYLKSVLDSEGIGSQIFTLEPGRGSLVAR